MNNPHLPSTLLRLGLAFAFLYAGVSSILQPSDWIGFLPEFLRNVSFVDTLLLVFSIFEIFLAFWLLSGKATFYAALVSLAMMLGIIASAPGLLIVTFRDVTIAFSAAALAVMNRKA